MRPMQDAVLIVRHQYDAMSVALEVYQREWAAAIAEGREPPEPPPASLADNKIIRVDTIKIILKAP
jgi:hypothetical protein